MMAGFDKTFCIGCGLSKQKSSMGMVMGHIGLCKTCTSLISATKDMTFRGKEFIEFAVSPFLYEGVIGDILREFKFKGQRLYGDFLTAAAIEYFKRKDLFSEYNLIVPVPLHKIRYDERGYNQAEIIAVQLGKILNKSVDSSSLIRIRNTKRQSSLNGYDRIKNVKDAFFSESDNISGKNIILVDDVYTMGETANECAKTLKSAGANKVMLFTICKANLKGNLF